MGKFRLVTDEFSRKSSPKRLYGASTFEYLSLNCKEPSLDATLPDSWAAQSELRDAVAQTFQVIL